MTVTWQDIQAASARIEGVAHVTPVLTSTTANDLTGGQLYFKAENFQRMGAFKFRGAYNAISQFTPEQMEAGVIAFSSGNHAQAIALAAKLLGTKATIVMPQDAPPNKLAATRGYGAEVVLYDRYTEDREAIGNRIAAEQGGTVIPPYDHEHVIAGQGTAAKELIEEVGQLDVAITSLGGGGLLAGTAIATHALCPNAAIYGVEPEAGNDGQRSFRSGEIVTIETPKTIADGAQTLHLGEITFPIIQEHVTDIVTANDEELLDAMRFMAYRMKTVVEPTGCLPLAAIFNGQINVTGKRVGIILSGGNISDQILRIEV
ncbi:MAG: threo-3-hydroxy-L-aspartate ammonia-lyase [Thermomicrobiales bacterium]|nr:threo-3-hydroxy-L-aspartate ammonia-lyase [Thermomicrobiales bacterium]